MYLQLKNYKYANEILYILKNVFDITKQPVSKLGVQKIFYLTASLAPIKKIIFSILKFKRIQRGPYSKEIQNTIDHLVAFDLVKITKFKVLKDKYSIAYYEITQGGINAVKNLIEYKKEEEKYWWIKSIVKLSNMFTSRDILREDDEFEGIDKIVRLVYQDFTFKSVKENEKFGALIDFENDNGLTYKIIKFTKEYIEKNENLFVNYDDRTIAELILIAFFEQLYASYIGSF